MDRLRWPFLLLALLIILVVVLIERSALRATDVAARLPSFVTGPSPGGVDQALAAFSPEQSQRLEELRREKADEIQNLEAELSGFGVESLQFVDGFLVFTLALMTVALVVPEYVQAKIQGVITAIFAIVVILAGIIKAFLVLAKLLTMVALLLAFPFGTLAYLIIYGDFPRAAGNAVLSLIFLLKFLLVIVLVLAHQRFAENKGLVIFVILAFVANLIVSFLYGIVPGFLVSITDAIAALVVILIGIILAIVLLILAIVSIIMALKPV